MRPRRILVIAALIAAAVPIQMALLGRFALLGAKPELATLLVVTIAMLYGPLEGAVVGFAAGLLLDSMTALPDGLYALVLAGTGATIGWLRALLQRPSAWVPAATVGIATVASLAVYLMLAWLVGAPVAPTWRTAFRILLAGVYGAALTPFVYPLLQRLLAERSKSVIGSVVVRR